MVKIKYPIGKIVYVIFNHEVQKVKIKKIVINENSIVYNDYITEDMVHSSYNACHVKLMANFSKLIKIVDKTK